MDSLGKVQYYHHFENTFASLVQGSHIVFNNSRVLDARLFVYHHEQKVELMLLDLGEVNVHTARCHDTRLRAMLRTDSVTKDQVFTLVQEAEGKNKNSNLKDVVRARVVDVVG